jgi:hypothetical protein
MVLHSFTLGQNQSLRCENCLHFAFTSLHSAHGNGLRLSRGEGTPEFLPVSSSAEVLDAAHFAAWPSQRALRWLIVPLKGLCCVRRSTIAVGLWCEALEGKSGRKIAW